MIVSENSAHANRADKLRRRADDIAGEKTAQMPENLGARTPEEVSRLFHELRVHQIEIELQNEELRRTQIELDDSRARYFDLYDLAPVGYVTINEKGLILEANLTIAKLLGIAKSQLIKQPLSLFIVAEDQNIYYLHRKHLLETGAPQACELRMVNKEGDACWVRVEAIGAQDDDGAFLCRAVISEITELKRVEELRIQNERFAQVLNGLDALVYVVDMQTYEIVFINTYGRNIWGDIEGKICWQTIQTGLAGPCEFCATAKLIGPDGNLTDGVVREFQNTISKRWYDYREKAIYWPDGRIVRIEIATDITRRKEAEDALAAESRQLAEANTALKVLLKRLVADQTEMEYKIVSNIRELVFPYLDKLRSFELNEVQANCLEVLAANLSRISAPFMKNLSTRYANFTSREIQVANMIREGKTSKEIARLFNVSIRSVDFHRDNIRMKLGLRHKKANLRLFLVNLDEK